MKLLHLGDLHIGKSMGEFSLIEDQKFILEQILNIAQEEGVNAILIAGDVYDKAIPSEQAVRVFNDFLCALAAKKIKTFVISGNHDSDERLNFGSSLFENSGIYIAAKYEGKLYKQEVEDEKGKVNIYLLPFVKASQVRHYFPEEEINTYEDAVRVILQKADINIEERNVLVAHQFVTGEGTEPEFGGSESAAVLNVGTVERIHAACFRDFDYVALGHIHSPQKVEWEKVRYCGSLLKYSLSEVRGEKSVPLVTLGEKGNVDIKLLPLKPLRDVRHLKGRLEQLLDKKNIHGQEDFIYVTLTDEDTVNDAMSIFQQYYPNTIKIDYDNTHTRGIEQMDISQIAQNRTFGEVIADFYRSMYGCDISEEEMAVMEAVAREAGVMDEAD